MCDRRLIHNSSAHPDRLNTVTAVNEGLRILLNISSSFDRGHRAELLTELAAKLRESGYREVFRGQVIVDCVAGWERKVRESDTRGTPLYRPRDWKKLNRLKKKRIGRSWTS